EREGLAAPHCPALEGRSHPDGGGFSPNKAIRCAHFFFHFLLLSEQAHKSLKTKKPDFRRALFGLAEREGFEPPEVLPSTVFKTAAFDHSATSPLCMVLRIGAKVRNLNVIPNSNL